MSTPSGKPFDPFDISAYAPKKARRLSLLDRQEEEEPISTEQDREDEGLAATPPFTLKREWPIRAPQGGHPVDLDQGTVPKIEVEPAPELSALDAAQPGEGTEIRSAEESPAKFETLGTPSDDEERPESRLGFAKAPELAHDHSPPEPPTARDEDIERLESSLRWLQREDASNRLPRAAQLPPVRGLAPTRKHSRKGDAYINGFRLPRSLEPEFVPPPPIRVRRDNLRGPMRILIASVIAAPIAYYLTTGGVIPDAVTGRTAKYDVAVETRAPASIPAREPAGVRANPAETVSGRSGTVGMLPPKPEPEMKLAPVAPAATAEPVSGNDGAPREQAATPARQQVASVASGTSLVVKDTPRTATSAANQAGAPSQPLRRLEPEDIKLLIQQGEQFVAAGDLVTARVVFQRAAEAGDAMGALALGATYDPFVLAKLGARGIGADVEKARSWYEKARDFGSSEAPRRLEMLANR